MEVFGKTPAGQEAHLYTLRIADGTRVEITDFGCAVVRWWTPDRRGELADIVLGFDAFNKYAELPAYFGTVIGRYGNRIANGTFNLDGKTFYLAKNNQPGGIPCHLHGGVRGFNKVLWHAEETTTSGGPALRLSYRSVDGEEGYPGNLDVTVTYTLTPERELRIDYAATTDQATPVNLTNHTFFNLAGEGIDNVLGQALTLHASHYTPVNPGLIPTGEIAPVAGTPFDFLAPHSIGARIDAPNEQLRLAGGYDHNFVLDSPPGALALAAMVFEPKSGRLLEVRTTEPGVQFYSGNFLNGSLVGKNGHAYGRRSGFCLETQHYPNSPNQPSFPSTILRPGATLRSTTVYKVASR